MSKTITTFALAELMNRETVNLIDIREVYEHQSGHASGSTNIPLNDLVSNANSHLNKDETYYLICQSGGRSQMAVQYLNQLGYDVIDVIGGHNLWTGDLNR